MDAVENHMAVACYKNRLGVAWYNASHGEVRRPFPRSIQDTRYPRTVGMHACSSCRQHTAHTHSHAAHQHLGKRSRRALQ